MGRTACTEPQCLYKGALCINFFWKKANWIGHILGRNCLLKYVTEGRI